MRTHTVLDEIAQRSRQTTGRYGATCLVIKEAAMRRAINWFVVFLSFLFLFFGLAMTGCGSSGGGPDAGGPGEPVDPLADTGMLRPVRNSAELESTLRTALAAAVVGVPDGPVTAAPTATGGAADFSGTYTAEAGVDELDTTRYDGQYLYVATWSFGVVAAPEIRILRTDPTTATATPVGLIALDPSQYVQGMYVENGRLLVVSTEAYMGPWGDAWALPMIWAPSKFTVQVHDVRDPAHPQRLMSATLDGGFVASRRIDDRVVLVSRHSPRALLDSQQRRRLQEMPLAELLPSITLNGRKESLVDPRHCYINNGEGRGYPVITSLTTLSLSNPTEFANTCYDESTTGVYASRTALYIAEPVYAAGSAEKTRIHKFSLGGSRAQYAGSAEIAGAVWTGGQADFRMSESGDLLRVVTTEFTNDASDWFDYRLFVLRPKTTERALEIVGRLPSDARPEEIGKPNERLFGVRFDGDRAYGVTFLRIDPLYVFDLSTPADPRIAGLLELPGVSDFLHPVSRDLLLGLGTDAGRLKLELFDTSVLEHPQSRGAISVGDSSSSSPALYERHAFTYLAGDQTDRLAVPAVLYTQSSGVLTGWTNELRQFEILGKQVPASASLQAAGAVSPPPPGGEYAYQPERAYISGDSVYYVREGKVWGSFWATPSQVNGPY
jgi:hypothetical protein